MKLVSERAEIEKMYAKSLKEWAKKWNNIIEKGKTYLLFILWHWTDAHVIVVLNDKLAVVYILHIP